MWTPSASGPPGSPPRACPGWTTCPGAGGPGDFEDLDTLAERILAFQARYNAHATPFDWTYTRDNLNDFLRRLSDHQTTPTASTAA